MKTFRGPTNRFMRGISFAAVLAGIAGLHATKFNAHAVTISATATNLTDTTPGQDLWQIQYTVSNLSITTGQGFSIFFDFTLYGNLQSPPQSANTGWNLLSVQPDELLESDGFFDALAMQDAPSLANPFTLTFVWLGTGTPGMQPFTVYDSTFHTLSIGYTAPTNPPSGPAISLVALSSDTLRIAWSPANAVLESSADLITWTPMPNAVNPLTLVLDNPQDSRYLRARAGP